MRPGLIWFPDNELLDGVDVPAEFDQVLHVPATQAGMYSLLTVNLKPMYAGAVKRFG